MLYSSCKSSNSKLVASIFLDQIYQVVKIKVDIELTSNNYFNFFINKNVNIKKKQVINLCCYVSQTPTTNKGSFYFKTDVGVPKTMSAIIHAG